MNASALLAAAAAMFAVLAVSTMVVHDGAVPPPRDAPDDAPLDVPRPGPAAGTACATSHAERRREREPRAPRIQLTPTEVVEYADDPRQRFLVVDANAAPVAGAIVTVRRLDHLDGRDENDPNLLVCALRTDRDGCAEAVVREDCFVVEARRGGVGRSLRSLEHRSHDAHVLRLEALVTLGGVVQRSDGSPVPGALVTARLIDCCDSRSPTTGDQTPAVAVADLHGRFALQVLPYDLELRASLDGAETLPAHVAFGVPREDVTLILAGSFTVGGFVVDAPK